MKNLLNFVKTKTTVLSFTVLLLSNCITYTKPQNSQLLYVPSTGCSTYKVNSERLRCISELVSAFEELQNSTVTSQFLSKERFSEEYVSYTTRYCYVSKSGKTYLCFDSTSQVYEPTPWCTLRSTLFKVGAGFLVGVVTGVSVLP